MTPTAADNPRNTLKKKYFSLIVIAIGVLLSTTVFVAERLIAPAPLTIIPFQFKKAHTEFALYADGMFGGKSTVKWQDEGARIIHCNIVLTAEFPVCGVAIKFPLKANSSKHMGASGEFFHSLDLTPYNALEIDFVYEGPAEVFQLYLRNNENRFPTIDQERFMSMFAPSKPHESPLIIRLNDLSVPTWWLEKNNFPEDDTKNNFENIVSIGLDLVNPVPEGEHLLTINQITATHILMSPKQRSTTHISIWVLVLLIIIIKKITDHIHTTRSNKAALSNLMEDYKSLHLTARTDPLTKVYNRLAINEIAQAIEKQKSELEYSVLLLDIDHFKAVNDNYSHDAGDYILSKFSELIKNNIRESDNFGRWGGEEFVLISQIHSEETALKLANKLRQTICEHPFNYNELPLKITASIGVANWARNESFEDCLARSDKALYLAKNLGRNRAELHDE